MENEPYPKCVKARESWEARKLADASSRKIIEIAKVQNMYRLVRQNEYEQTQNVPKSNHLTNSELSVLLDDGDLDLEKVLSESEQCIGVWRIPVTVFPAAEQFEICHDPFDDEGKPQHPNHGIIICKKNNAKGRQVVNEGTWEIEPKSNSQLDNRDD